MRKPRKVAPEPLDEAITALRAALDGEVSHAALERASVALEEITPALRGRLREALQGPSTRDRVRELAGQGLDNATIAARLGVRADYVQRLRVLEGSAEPGKPGRPRDPWEDKLRPLLEQGLSVQDMAEQLGWAVTTTRNRVSTLRAQIRAEK